jgi:hypothetical protein
MKLSHLLGEGNGGVGRFEDILGQFAGHARKRTTSNHCARGAKWDGGA